MPFAVIDAVQGRTEDSLLIRGVTIRPRVFHDVMDLVPNHGWQVLQESPDRLRVLLAGASEPDAERLRTALRSNLTAHGVADAPAVLIDTVSQVPKSPSGKAPLIRALRSGPAPS
jgi:phenylacetate-coenzyme A ligase PaaK-like adenylate-forming protein